MFFLSSEGQNTLCKNQNSNFCTKGHASSSFKEMHRNFTPAYPEEKQDSKLLSSIHCLNRRQATTGDKGTGNQNHVGLQEFCWR